MTQEIGQKMYDWAVDLFPIIIMSVFLVINSDNTCLQAPHGTIVSAVYVNINTCFI